MGDIPRPRETNDASLAFVLTGGGARAAYQVGVLRYLAAHFPEFAPGILTGVSAGGMIAMHLASRRGRFMESVARLTRVWQSLRIDDVCEADSAHLAAWVGRWALRRICGRRSEGSRRRSLASTEPLRQLLTRTLDAEPDGTLEEITRNLREGVFKSVALTASSYSTGQSVTWVQSGDGFSALMSDGARRERLAGCLRVDHVMASGALPFIFPAIEIDGTWYGDGGMRLTAPLSPAIRLGARRIIAVSTRYPRSGNETRPQAGTDHPRPAQVAGAMLNAIFLDQLDTDARRLRHINSLIRQVPPEGRGSLNPVDVLVLRPSQDLGRLANDFEADLPRGFRFLLRRRGIGDGRSNDLLSLLMFQHDYISRLIDLGESDAHARAQEIAAFLKPDASPEHASEQAGQVPNSAPASGANSLQSLLFDTAALAAIAG